MTTAACPTAAALAAAFARAPSEQDRVRQHVARCARCAGEWAAAERVVSSYRKVQWPEPSSAHIEEQRTALLASAALAKPAATRRWGWWAFPAVAAAALTLAVVTRPAPSSEPSPETPFHGVLTTHGEAVFHRSSSRPDEVVSLETGTLSVEVSPLARGERFRIVTSDAEVEVRGTAFEVTADHGRLVEVHVWHGKVEVRPSVGGVVLLVGGQSWWGRDAVTARVSPTDPVQPATLAIEAKRDGAAITPQLAPAGHVNRQPSRQSQRSSTVSEPVLPDQVVSEQVADPGIRRYQEAWKALRAGDHASAATAFERAASLASDAALVEDAWYWRAVSLARANQGGEARAAFAAFLEHYRHSPRAPQASAMLGWLLFDSGDLESAERRFRVAADDPAPTVRDSAIEGLDAIRRRRAK